MDPIVAKLTAPVAKKAMDSLLGGLAAQAKGAVAKKIARWRALKNVKHAYEKLREVRYVKTLWQVERAVDLLTFYYPSSIVDGKSSTPIHSIDDFPGIPRLVVQGTVGQGKSIFFRYLATTELYRGRFLPLFLELRRIQQDWSLTDHLSAHLDSLGFKVDHDLLDFLLGSGKLLLLLDAFDEIPERRRAAIVDELENIVRRHPSLPILITSRPESGIAASNAFRVVQLRELARNEYPAVVNRLCGDPVMAKEISKGVKQSSIAELLTTPLMVALLVFRYRADQSTPENSVAFFDDLFPLLLRRHDKTKAGYIRPRRSRLGDAALAGIFDALCYLLKRDDVPNAFTARVLSERVRAACVAAGVQCAPDVVVDDFVKITCLILEDAGECRFIHKSVQEYHTARFVRTQPDDVARRFYEAMRTRWSAWDTELGFLATIDEYRWLKWYHVPELRRIVELRDDIDSVVRLVFSGLSFSVSPGKPYRVMAMMQTGHQLRCLMRGIGVDNIFRAFEGDLGEIPPGLLPASNENRLMARGVEAVALYQAGVAQRSFAVAVREIGAAALKQLEAAQAQISRVEQNLALFSFPLET